MAACCSKLVCNGCIYANQKREYEGRLGYKCVFCRKAVPTTDQEYDKQRMNRVEANDPVALRQEGIEQDKKGNYISAFEYYTKEKEIHHLEEAAIGGHPDARHNLGCIEEDDYNIVRAVKHWIIAATQGHDSSIEALMSAFKGGEVRKDVLAAALRAHKTAVDATKSPQRDAAEEYRRKWSIVEPK
ncbi:hypothetical protein QTG54_015672 [Skeletonema marinoi]|uniref:Uncharacterized protein n=1 Tax=Skeletonema marinoi TaxID=267567 RepID=A0AAD8XTK6_9STRA|nr:hypothetical protein QTG54_015672 [Skeletonema marinoi]